MVGESENIVHARVTGVRAEPHPQFRNLNTTVVTLDVIEPLKGSPGRQLTFRQYSPASIGSGSVSAYRAGEEIVLMLRKPSAEGMTSPVGFEQGRFLIERDAVGNATVRNGMDNAALLSDMDVASPGLRPRLSPALQALLATHRAGPIAYGQFKALVLALVAAPEAPAHR